MLGAGWFSLSVRSSHASLLDILRLATFNADIVFPTATTDWGTARYIAIFDSAVAGNLLWWGQMRVGKFVATSAIFTVEAGDLELDAGGAFSLYSRDGVLNMTLRNAAFTSPTNVPS